jgi:hypothetical protein
VGGLAQPFAYSFVLPPIEAAPPFPGFGKGGHHEPWKTKKRPMFKLMFEGC